MKKMIMRFVPILLGTCLWTTGNILLSYIPVRAQEVAQNDPNNPTCIWRDKSADATNCALQNKDRPFGPCNPAGYCKKIHFKDWYCSPGDTGTAITVPGLLGIGTTTVIVGGNCHTFSMNRIVPIYQGPCTQTYDPTAVSKCNCPDGVLGNQIGTFSVVSTYCVNGTTTYALRLPPLKSHLKSVRVASNFVSTKKVVHP